MKNLLIYTNPAKAFSVENQTLVKIHIDNSLDLGWRPEDILLYTNFDYEYNGIRAVVVDDTLQCRWDRTSNKILVIQNLLNRGLLTGLCWYHDFDAYQNTTIDETEFGEFDLGVTGYGYKDQYNGGSFFFRETAKDIFNTWCARTFAKQRTRADEKALTDLMREGVLSKVEELNITYNFGQRAPRLCYDQADKPLKVLHFHPHYQYYRENNYDNLDMFMYGKNIHGFPMMSERLIRIFHAHGIR